MLTCAGLALTISLVASAKKALGQAVREQRTEGVVTQGLVKPQTDSTQGYYRQPGIWHDVVVFVSEGDLWKVTLPSAGHEAAAGGKLPRLVASRLTTHPGTEGHPAISPDGATLAFLASYEGPAEVYTMPMRGGLASRRSFGALRTSFIGFTPDGKVMYSTRQFSTLPSTQLVTVDMATNAQQRIALAEADQGDFSADGATLFFTRLPFQGSNTKRYKGGLIQQIWKYAKGDAEASPLTTDFEGTSKEAMWWNGRVYFLSDRNGTMNLWSMLPDGKDVQQHTRHTDFDAASPALSEGSIVYQHGADLWLYRVATGENDKLDITLASDFDQLREHWLAKPASYITASALSPDGDRLALTARGHLFVAPSKQGRLVELSHDSEVRYRGVSFMPDGKSVLSLSDASGEVEFYTLPANGVADDAPQARAGQAPQVAPGTSPVQAVPRQLTTGGNSLRWEGIPSPDGTWLVHHDKQQRLFLTNIATQVTTMIAECLTDQYRDIIWSRDSQWCVYVEPAQNGYLVLKMYSVSTQQTTTLTTDRYDSYSPRFSTDGLWLYFLSERHLASTVDSPWGSLAPEPFFDNRTQVFAISLVTGTRSPWQALDELAPKDENKKDDKTIPDKKTPDQPQPDKPDPAPRTLPDQPKPGLPPEKPTPSNPPSPNPPSPNPPSPNPPSPDKPAPEKPNPDKPSTPTAPATVFSEQSETKGSSSTDDGKEEKEKNGNSETPKPVVIELGGIMTRLVLVPVPPGNYGSLFVNDKALFMTEMPSGVEKKSLVAVKISHEKVEKKTVATDIKGFELSANGKKLLIQKETSFFIVDAEPTEAKLEDGKVNLSGWSFSVTPAEEWSQMYVDAWRLLRDYFYAANMHGVDWPAVRDKYAPLVARVRARSELNDILGQMSGELSALHHFVRGGDIPSGNDDVKLASLGCEWEYDAAAGGYRVTHVFITDPDEPGGRSPLAKPGVDVKNGDVIVAINGVRLEAASDPLATLRNKAGQQVLLQVVRAGTAAPAARSVIVTPIDMAAAADLRYDEWEYTRRLKVEEASKGDFGYLHLRAMGTENIAEFARGFYPAYDRKGLIIDVRRNNGGNIDSWILSRLMRKSWMYWNQHAGRAQSWNMQYAFRGHVVVLCDAFTASDGEAFSEGFKRLGLGKVIGQRTWGGEIWLSSSNILVDNGLASAGENGVFGADGTWLVEGRGVEPDITVDNLPHATFLGEDKQLDAAIAYLEQRVREQPVEIPPVPAFPDKSMRRK